jgi:FixJ family two-component response regulator
MSFLMPVNAIPSMPADRMMLMDMFAQPVSDEPDAQATRQALERMYIHVVASNQLERAAKAHLIFSLGHHAEVYEDADELIAMMPEQGLILLCEDGTGAACRLMEKMDSRGIWLPVIAFARTLDCDAIVAGIKAGVVNYLVGDASPAELLTKLHQGYAEGQACLAIRLRQALARRAIKALSRREAEVLRLVTTGLSNKEIARELDISPRTVEIHRMKMMTKLGAKTSAQAIRVEIEAAGLA